MNLIEDTWTRRSVIWLSGVRRAGKTYLCHSLGDVDYFDCELPRTRQALGDPQAFLDDHKGRRVVIDEIHRLDRPSELLKIAADYYPNTKVIATGSSTLGASAKFKDTLAGRKSEIWLTPMILADLDDFGQTDLAYRFLRGGLPPFFLDPELPEREFQEWVDAYWAKDIQQLFRLERRQSFAKFAELLMVHSGGIFEATRYATACEVSRGTISNYLAVMEATFLAHVIRPFSSHRPSEIVLAPKVYSFDTGFVCYHRGITDLRNEDFGMLWEHFVLNELQARLQTRDIHYWRDKRGHEVDFVLARRNRPPTAIECKWTAGSFDPTSLRAFRRHYPEGESFVVAHDTPDAYSRDYDGIKVRFVDLPTLIEAVSRVG
jgi:predicted AAA+ superfamily ATPase